MENEKRNNPWLGLKSYGEQDRIYGRDADIRALTQAVLSCRELLFFGKSGIGKSSILMAGLVGMSRENGFLPLVLRLEHNGIGYVEQVRQALTSEGVTLVEKELRRGDHELVWEFFHRYEFRKDNQRVKPLIIFDQFEEIFTLTENKADVREFFAELADYVNDVKPRSLDIDYTVDADKSQENTDSAKDGSVDMFGDIFEGVASRVADNYVMDNDVHLIFTIREDFLSEFEYYARAIPSLKQHQYLLRPLDEEQAAEVIMRPRPGLVSEEVARLIIEKVTGCKDVSLDGTPDIEVDAAVLSLYLEQLYEACEGETITQHLVEEKGGHIIEQFYESVAEKVSRETIEYLEDELINADGRRENRSVSTVEHKIGRKELQKLVSMQLLRLFRRGNDLMVEYIHDILCPVIQMRKERRSIERKMMKRRRKARWTVRGVVAAVVIAVAVLVGRYLLYEKEYSECYVAYVKVNGYPVGIGEPLSEKQVAGQMVAYRLVRRGYSLENKTRCLEVIRKDSLAASGIELPLVGDAETETDPNAKAFARSLKTVDHIRFIGRDKINREVAYDKNDNVIYSLNYYEESGWYWACFMKENGGPLLVRGSADRMKILYDRAGHERKILFYDAMLVPHANYVGFYGVELTYDNMGRRDTVWTLNPFGDRELVQVWNYTDKGVEISSNGEKAYRLEFNTDGSLQKRIAYIDGQESMVTLYEYDKGAISKLTTMTGNVETYKFMTKTEDLWSDTTVISLPENLAYRSHTVRDKKGRVVEISYFSAKSGKPIIFKDMQAHKMCTKWEELKDGCLRRTDSYYDTRGKLMADKDGAAIGVRTYDKWGNLILWSSLKKDGTPTVSMKYEYKEGQEYMRYAVGVDGTPIRCPHLEGNELTYYKLMLRRDAYGNFVNGVAINEWGDRSIFYIENNGAKSRLVKNIQSIIVPFVDGMWNFESVMNLNYNPPTDLHAVDYIHILSKRGAAYRAGLRDGDVILKGKLVPGGTVIVKRLGKVETPCTITIDNDELMAEHYKVYLTKEEYAKLMDN